MWFIDKLNVHQEHQADLPLVGSEMVLRVDLQTGERVSEAPRSKQLEGSYSSKLEIRCNGDRVSVRGNPSRWHRSDNLFGFTRLSDCIAVYNRILQEHGLPPFTQATKFWYRQGEDGSRSQLVCDGALIDHIDFTRNFGVSRGKEQAFLRGLAGQAIGKGKEPYLYANGCTVDWYKGSTMLYKKVYVKAFDLIKHKAKRLKNCSEEEEGYYQRLIDWCNELGILREEHSFKAQWLRRKKLCFYGMTEESDFAEYLNDIENAMNRFEVMKLDYETIADQLLENEIVNSRQAANATQCFAFKWLHGIPIERNRQYYVHRPRLLQLGIDISVPYDVTKMPPQVRSNALIDVRSVEPPSWYRMPEVHTLRRVA